MNLFSQAILGFELPVELLFNIGPFLGVILFALPSYLSLLRQKPLRAVLIIVLLGGLSLAIETLTLKSGIPYGKFSYDAALGNKLLGSTPWVLALAYPPVLLAVFWFVTKFTRGGFRPLLAALLGVVAAASVNPAAVKLQLWQMEQPGPYFGISIAHFGGWLVGGFIASYLLHIIWGQNDMKRGAAVSGAAIIWFWTWVNAGINQWIPFGLGLGLSLLLAIAIWRSKKPTA